AADGFSLPIPFRDSLAQVGTEAHYPKIPNQDRRAVLAADRDVLQITEAFDVANAADQVAGAGHFEHAPSDLVVTVANPVDDRLKRDVQGEQPIGIELDLVLPGESANARDLRDSGHGFQLITDVPVLKSVEIGQIKIVALVQQDVFVNPAGAGGV